ncbi:MAG: hypothetical protein ACOX0K_02215 [Oscillospiraceae bacterium]
MILDGRSTEPGSAPALLEELDAGLAEIGMGTIVDGVGRGIALDRDGNYHIRFNRPTSVWCWARGGDTAKHPFRASIFCYLLY